VAAIPKQRNAERLLGQSESNYGFVSEALSLMIILGSRGKYVWLLVRKQTTRDQTSGASVPPIDTCRHFDKCK